MKQQVLEFIRKGGDFEQLALKLFAWQVERIPHYARFCAGATPGDLHEIPAVPVSLFRDLNLCASENPGALFRTSGTTTGARGIHRMPDTEVYDFAAKTWFEQCVPLQKETQWISLVPNPQSTPDSSLGHMVATLAPQAQWFLQPKQGVAIPPALKAIEEARPFAKGLNLGSAFAELDGLEALVFLPDDVFEEKR